MEFSHTVRCPRCYTDDVYGFERTRTGRYYYCPSCGNRWKLTVEDEVLAMIEGFHTTRSVVPAPNRRRPQADCTPHEARKSWVADHAKDGL